MSKLFFLVIVSILSNGAIAAPITFDCSYQKYSDEAGSHNFSETFSFKFLWDEKKNVAYLIGNLRTEPVQVVKGAKRISFIEITPNGNVNTTTIRESGESIHSRHNAGLPSQSYGKCDIQ